jgi:hypothetical protein
MDSRSEELVSKGGIKPDENYVIITKAGKEYNIVVEEVGEHWIFGHVATNRFALLYAEPAVAILKAAVLPQDVAKRINDDKSNKVFVDTAVALDVPSQKLRLDMKEIAGIEDPWRPFIPSSIVDDDGMITDGKAATMRIKQFEPYLLDDGKFVSSPGAWPQANIPFIPQEEEEESTDHEGGS